MSDFYWSPAYGFTVSKTPKILEAPFGDGYSQRSARGINNNAGKWSLQFTNIADTIADAIEAFLDAHSDGASFTWTPPNDTVEIVVYCKQYSRSFPTLGVSNISADFQQVFGE